MSKASKTDITSITKEEVNQGVSLVFKDRYVMFVKIAEPDSKAVDEWSAPYCVTFNITDEEAEHLEKLGANVKEYQGAYRVTAYSKAITRDGMKLRPPVVTDSNGKHWSRQQRLEGIPNGSRADIYIWLKTWEYMAPLRFSGIQVKKKANNLQFSIIQPGTPIGKPTIEWGTPKEER